MTGLSQATAEPLQVQNYGIGGHYLPHWDCLMKGYKPFETDGNRIATVLFYVRNLSSFDQLFYHQNLNFSCQMLRKAVQRLSSLSSFAFQFEKAPRLFGTTWSSAVKEIT